MSDELWDLRNLAQARRLSDWMFEQFAEHADGVVAEVGAGIGTYSDRLLRSGRVDELLLVEPEDACVSELRTRFSGDPRVTITDDLLPEAPSLAALGGRVDFVLCQNVLEHIAADGPAMSAMAAALKPGGVLGLIVPAHPRLYGKLDAAYGHERRYDKSRLRRLAAEAGLEVERLYRFNLLGTFGWLASRWQTQPSLSPGKLRAYEALLPPFRAFERRVKPPFGLSLVLLARRPPSRAPATEP
jgi:SAM-dependent methyltransferase